MTLYRPPRHPATDRVWLIGWGAGGGGARPVSEWTRDGTGGWMSGWITGGQSGDRWRTHRSWVELLGLGEVADDPADIPTEGTVFLTAQEAQNG